MKCVYHIYDESTYMFEWCGVKIPSCMRCLYGHPGSIRFLKDVALDVIKGLVSLEENNYGYHRESAFPE